MRTYICKICKQNIYSDLFEKTNISKSKRKYIYRYHKSCYDNNIRLQAEKDEFFQYIKTNFFNVSIPKIIFVEFSNFNCSYKDLLECCHYIDLINTINKKSFANDFNKSKYIIAVIKNNINTYIKNNINIPNNNNHEIVFLNR